MEDLGSLNVNPSRNSTLSGSPSLTVNPTRNATVSLDVNPTLTTSATLTTTLNASLRGDVIAHIKYVDL